MRGINTKEQRNEHEKPEKRFNEKKKNNEGEKNPGREKRKKRKKSVSHCTMSKLPMRTRHKGVWWLLWLVELGSN
jgi:hypothetical protein